ncbi:MAG TPA: glucose-6-phosphate dehydrogenase [Kouleothrix sp.]|uniref:glucose-6-phosphate dehydrogenase n=1 Tax=Kouleothrix sp. TaxID=2779161 RepID=UPI002C85E5E5|nr:glucose-6-phosphate dehydrogenase [Kouleothrix sp.]HRC74712.1 glucose-6-phosphate dehydrogenase [Kouleothrix sp.]
MPSPTSAQPARTAAPCTVVIFGASGDLTQRKLVPALYNLRHDGLLPDGFALVGFARREKSDEQFRAEMHEGVAAHSRTQPIDEAEWASFASSIHYHTASFDDAAGYDGLRALLDRIDAERGVAPGQGNRLFYLATPPDAYPRIVTHLGAAGLNGPPPSQRATAGWTRIIIEKPFGRDLASAQALNTHVLGVFDESQVYRIDHYLGKETVQNILTFRLGNSIFEPLWNRRYIDHVQILVAEQIGVAGRGGYYDTAGAIRDMVQNHMLQVLALTAMEPPAAFTADAVRNEKVKALQAIRPIAPEETGQYTARGQYTEYRNEPGVVHGSSTETFVAMKLAIDNWRWSGVPFYLRTGKALPQRLTEIMIQFKQPPLMLFGHGSHAGHSGPAGATEPNVLILRIQPNEGIAMRIGLKPPGSSLRLQPVELGFDYGSGFGKESPEAYERLLLDAILGDATLFIRRDEVEAAWALITPVIEGWEAGHAPKPAPYWSGTWGPDSADALIERDGRAWRLI